MRSWKVWIHKCRVDCGGKDQPSFDMAMGVWTPIPYKHPGQPSSNLHEMGYEEKAEDHIL